MYDTFENRFNLAVPLTNSGSPSEFANVEHNIITALF